MRLAGQTLTCSTRAGLSDAFSLMEKCATQQEIDLLWEWLGDPERGGEVARVMLQMQRLEITPLEAALRG